MNLKLEWSSFVKVLFFSLKKLNSSFQVCCKGPLVFEGPLSSLPVSRFLWDGTGEAERLMLSVLLR